MGSADRVVRLLVAAALLVLFFTHIVIGIWGGVVLGIAGIFLLTSLIGVCPLYSVFGGSTCKKSSLSHERRV